jgi:hypothetical protein
MLRTKAEYYPTMPGRYGEIRSLLATTDLVERTRYIRKRLAPAVIDGA